MRGLRQGGKEPPILLHITTVPMSLSFLRGQTAFMKARGFEIHAVSSPGPDLDAFAERESIPVHPVQMTREITPVADIKALAGIRRVLQELEPDVVHAHTPKAGLLGMIAAAGGTGVRIYQMRGLPFVTTSGPRRWVLRQTERISCALADLVICNSHSLRTVALEERLCGPDKIKVLGAGSGNGVDAEERFDPGRLPADARSKSRARFGIPSEAFVVGFVGRITREKGIVELAEAWRMFRDRHAEAHLLIVGPHESRDPIPYSTRGLFEEDPRVHMAGMDWNTPPLYAAMDLVVLPTYREGFPNVPLEAAAMRLPVVATRVEGCVDAVQDGITGMLVPPRDARSLNEAIWAYADDERLRRAHGMAGRARALSDFRPEAMWELYHREYEKLSRLKRNDTLRSMTQAA